MKTTHTLEEQAAGKINLAMRRLAERYPFHVAVLEQFKISCWPRVLTMGVTIIHGRLILVHNPEFVLATPLTQLTGVLLHEVHHVLLGHLLADPKQFHDEWARIVAEETTVNEFVKEPLPKGVIKLEDFPQLPPMESTKKRYQRLRKVRRRFPIEAQPESMPSTSGASSSPDQSAQGTPSGAKSAAARGDPRHTLDDHGLWEEIGKDPEAAKDAIQAAVQQAALEAGNDVPEELKPSLQALGVGNEPAFAQTYLAGDHQGKLDWRLLLRRYVGQELGRQPVFGRPPRRFPEMAGVIPGQGRRPQRAHVMAVIDTSGSITDDLLELISAELHRLSRHYRVTIVECDGRHSPSVQVPAIGIRERTGRHRLAAPIRGCLLAQTQARCRDLLHRRWRAGPRARAAYPGDLVPRSGWHSPSSMGTGHTNGAVTGRKMPLDVQKTTELGRKCEVQGPDLCDAFRLKTGDFGPEEGCFGTRSPFFRPSVGLCLQHRPNLYAGLSPRKEWNPTSQGFWDRYRQWLRP